MRRKLLSSFFIVLLIGVSITGLFSFKQTRDFYLNSLEQKLISNGKLISQLFLKMYNPLSQNYDEEARELSKICDARVTIIAEDGKVIGESDTQSIAMDNHKGRYEVQEALLGRIGKSLRYSSTGRIDMMYIALPVGNNDFKGVIRLSVPINDIQKIQWNFLRYVALGVFIGIFIASIIAYTFVGRITKPLNEMMYMSSLIAEGNYGKRINLTSEDEIGKLSETFNNMAEKLQISISDLHDKKNKLEAILKSMQSGVIAVDNIGKIILANPAALNMFGFTEDILGKHILEVIRNVELHDIIGKGQNDTKEIRLNFPEKRILRVKTAPIENKDIYKKNMGMVVVMQDITELKQLEQMRSEFVANVSHELKTPLTSIKGFAETLKGGAISDEATREKFLDIINVEADRLTRLINDILVLSELENKRQNIIFDRISINDAIEEIEDMMLNIAKLKNINISFSKDEKLPKVMGNHDKVKQLLINLIDNAIKYTPEGGSVRVKTYYEDKKVYIKVSDTGIGISKEHLPRLFERFYRVDKGRSRALGGTGLGLAIVKHIAAAMNASIDVDSELGKGTTFTIIIPI